MCSRAHPKLLESSSSARFPPPMSFADCGILDRHASGTSPDQVCAIPFAKGDNQSSKHMTDPSQARQPFRATTPQTTISRAANRDISIAVTPAARRALQVDISVLSISHQIYYEASVVLWTTNLSSFEDPFSFDKFMASLNPAQKHKLTNLYVGIEFCRAPFRVHHRPTGNTDLLWSRALKPSYFDLLRGLQKVRLCFEQYTVGDPTGHPYLNHLFNDNPDADIWPFLNLRTLPRRQVTVIVSDNPTKIAAHGATESRWSADDKKRYSEKVRLHIMDPQV